MFIKGNAYALRISTASLGVSLAITSLMIHPVKPFRIYHRRLPERTSAPNPRAVEPDMHFIPSVLPINGYITSGFGQRISPIDQTSEFHRGIDIAAPAGTPVVAAANGRVKLAASTGLLGLLVVIDHGDGYETWYAHNEYLLVKTGDWVLSGQAIALLGTTGRSTGPHLHYEVWKNGQAIDPTPFLGSAASYIHSNNS